MEEKLIKILDEELNISEFNESNIAEYVQTKQTIDRLNKFAIQPFEEIAKERKKVLGIDYKLFYGADMIFDVETSRTPKHYTSKDILSLTTGVLGTALQNQELGKQMYGVKRFGDTPAIDASYVLNLVTDWQYAVIGENIREKVVCEADLKNIANQYAGMITLIDEPIIKSPTGFSHKAGALYLVSKGQVKELGDRVIKPFESAFKSMSEKNPNETSRNYHNYGGLSVFVKTVPRAEPNFDRSLQNTLESIDYFSGLTTESSSPMAFFNDSLQQPRTYIALEGLLDLISQETNMTDTKFRQEISILYNPKKATVIAR